LLWRAGWTVHGVNSLRFKCIRRNCSASVCERAFPQGLKSPLLMGRHGAAEAAPLQGKSNCPTAGEIVRLTQWRSASILELRIAVAECRAEALLIAKRS
jgi:hypothetical protein